MRKPRNIACRNLKVLNELINTSETQITEIQTFKELDIYTFFPNVRINNNTTVVEFEVYAFDTVSGEYHIIKGSVKNLSATLNISIYDTYVSDSDIINSYSITKNDNILNFEFINSTIFASYLSLQNSDRTGGGYQRYFDIDTFVSVGNLSFVKYDALGVVFKDENGGTISPVVFDTPFNSGLYNGVSFEFIDNTTGIRWFVDYSGYTYSPSSNNYLIFTGFNKAIKNYRQSNQTEGLFSEYDTAIANIRGSTKQTFEFLNLVVYNTSGILNYYLKTKSYNI